MTLLETPFSEQSLVMCRQQDILRTLTKLLDQICRRCYKKPY